MGVLSRGSTDVQWLTHRMRVHEARQHGDIVYALGQEPHHWFRTLQDGVADWVLLRIHPDLTIETVRRLSPDEAGDHGRFLWRGSVNLTVSNSGEPALAWQRREGGMLQLVVWRASVEAPIAVDTLVQAPCLAEASAYANRRVTLAPHGASDFAVAWRPSVDCGFDNCDPTSGPPAYESHWWPRAEVRWGVVRGRQTVMQRWATVVYPLGYSMGSGPRPFSRLRIVGTQVDGRAAFVWSSFDRSRSKKRLLAVFADSTAPAPLIASRDWEPELMTSGSDEITVLQPGREGWPRYALGMVCDAPVTVDPQGPSVDRSAAAPVDVQDHVPGR